MDSVFGYRPERRIAMGAVGIALAKGFVEYGFYFHKINSVSMCTTTLFIDVTTSLQWRAKTAVGIIRVERYLIRAFLETYPAALGLIVFDRDGGVFRSINIDETLKLLGNIYGDPHEAGRARKRTKLELMRQLSHREMVSLSTNFFDARIKGRLQAAGLPPMITQATAVVFRTSAVAASVLVKLMPRPAPTRGSPPKTPEGVPERNLASFEAYRDGYSLDEAWVLCAGLTWDYMHYPHLHQLRKSGRLRVAHVVYDTIPVDFPQYVPHASHVYHRHFVEVAQTASLLYAISEYSADRFKKAILEPNLLDGKVYSHGLPDFLDADVEEPQPVPRLNGREFVVFCSTIEPRKNHGLLLTVWKRLLSRRPGGDVPILVFVGKWGWAFEAVKNQIDLDPAIERHVVVLSELKDAELVWLYKNAMFTVFPSVSEGWGLAVSESLYHGTPVLVSTAPALNEAAQGLMPRLDPYDVVAWEAAVDELISSTAARDDLRQRAKCFQPIAVTSFADRLVSLMATEAT